MVVLCLLYLTPLLMTLPLQILLNEKTLGNMNSFSFLNINTGIKIDYKQNRKKLQRFKVSSKDDNISLTKI